MTGFHVSDALWKRIQPLIPRYINHHPRGGGRKRIADRIVFNVILITARTGCQWKALDAAGICYDSTVFSFYEPDCVNSAYSASFTNDGNKVCLNTIKKKLVWKWQAMDGAMTKAPLGGKKTGNNPTDRGKTGTKRSLLTDGNGIPIGVIVSRTNHESRLMESAFRNIRIKHPNAICYNRQYLCLDVGYVGDEVAGLAKAFGYTLHVRPRGEEAKELRMKAGALARRWVVERTHSWMNCFRRILTRWNNRYENYLAMLHLRCALITFGKFLHQ